MRSHRLRSGAALGARFVAIGLLNSAFHAGVVALLGLVVDHEFGFVAILVAWIMSLPVGYLTQATIVWRRPIAWSGFVKLSLSQIPNIAISTSLGAAVGLLGWSLFWQEVVALAAGAATSFLLQKFWVFRVSADEAVQKEVHEEQHLEQRGRDQEHDAENA